MIRRPNPSDPLKMMDNQPPEDANQDASMHEPSDLPFPFPQELVDFIIDILSDDVQQAPQHQRARAIATLCACALVAKGWTVRAQRGIFQWAEVHNTTSLYSFAETLRASRHLAGDVQRLTLMRRIRSVIPLLAYYPPDCAEVLFPTVLAGLLPNLRYLAFDELPAPVSSASQAVDEDLPGIVSNISRRFRPYVPIHPRFPLLLSSSGFSHLEELHLSAITFQTFNDLARTLCAFKSLRTLYCGDVDWVTPGVLLPSFMTTSTTPRNNGEFLPVLENLTMVTMGKHGPERLLSGLALSAPLRALTAYLPYMGTLHHTGPSIDPATGRPDGLDLSPFSHISEVTILGVTPYSFRSMQLSMLSVLHNMLASWNTASSRSLSLWIRPSPFSQQSERFYTKQNYLNFLAAVGRTVEDACTRNRGSSIPTLYVHLEIPQDAKTPLEELEREAIARFPITSKAGRLTVKAYTSDSYYYSWKSSTIDAGDP